MRTKSFDCPVCIQPLDIWYKDRVVLSDPTLLDPPVRYLNFMTLQILVIHNPTAGRRRQKQLDKLLKLLEARAFDVHAHSTLRQGDAREAARSAVNIDVIIAAGGDGTVNEVIDGMCQRAPMEKTPTVGFLPLGTVNVLALEAGLPRTPEGLVRLLEKRKTLPIRPGIANGRRFVLMASAGIDARAVACVDPRLKKRIGPGAYVFAALRAVRRKSPDLGVVVDGTSHKAHTVIITRARCYGGAFVVAPNAGLAAPNLQVVLLQSTGFWSLLRYGMALVTSRLSALDDVVVLEGENVSVDGPEGEPVQLDGDIACHLPVTITLEEKTIDLLVP